MHLSMEKALTNCGAHRKYGQAPRLGKNKQKGDHQNLFIFLCDLGALMQHVVKLCLVMSTRLV